MSTIHIRKTSWDEMVGITLALLVIILVILGFLAGAWWLVGVSFAIWLPFWPVLWGGLAYSVVVYLILLGISTLLPK